MTTTTTAIQGSEGAAETRQDGVLSHVTSAIASIDPSVPVDVVAEALGRIEHAKRLLKTLEADCERLILEWVAANGDLVIGPIRYYAGTKKETRERDHALAVVIIAETLGITLTAGQAETLASLLSSNPWKVAPSREVLGERFDEVFGVVEKEELREGKPVKRLLKVDERFLK